MSYVIYTRYVDEIAELAAKYAQAHMDYLGGWEEKLIASGGLRSETGELIGGCIIVAVDTLEEAEEFLAKDPLSINGLIREATVTHWYQTFLHGRADQNPFVALPKK